VSEQLNQGLMRFIVTWVHDQYFSNCSGGLKLVKFATNRSHHVEASFVTMQPLPCLNVLNIMTSTCEKDPLPTCNVDDTWSSTPHPHPQPPSHPLICCVLTLSSPMIPYGIMLVICSQHIVDG